MTLNLSEHEDPRHEEDVIERVDEIKTYLLDHFPVVALENIPKCYVETPDPSTLPQYQGYRGPWLARLVTQRKAMSLEFSLNMIIVQLLQSDSARNQ